jgi:hypothetical protein
MAAYLVVTDRPTFNVGVLTPRVGFARFNVIEFLLTLYSTVVLAILIHELGHIFAGKAVGLPFFGLQVGPLVLSKSTGKLKLSWQKGSKNGYAQVRFDSIRRISRHLRILVVGGPLANLLSAFLAYGLLISGGLRGLAFAWTQWFVYLSAFVFLVNLVPFKMRSGFFSDGARLKMLFFPSAKTYRWIAVIALGVHANSGKRSKLMNRRWLAMATRLNDNSRDEFMGTFYAYYWANDSEDESAAARCLERCLYLSSKARDPLTQNLIFLEASVFHAWFRKSAENCLKWRNRVSYWNKLPWFLILRADTAFLWSQGQVSEALNNCEQALSRADTLPAAHREVFRQGWKEWIDQIRVRSMATESVTRGLGGPS